MKQVFILAIFALISFTGNAQTYTGLINDGQSAQINIVRNGDVVTISRSLVNPSDGSKSKLVNLTNVSVDSQNRFNVSNADNIWIVPFDPNGQVNKSNGGCYEYRCECGACGGGGSGCKQTVDNGVYICKGEGQSDCSCCSGFLFKVACDTYRQIDNYGSSVLLISARVLNY